jgi:hypothetical protein
MKECPGLETGSVVQWLVFEVNAFYINLLVLAIQCCVYSSSVSSVKFIYDIKLVTRLQTLFKMKQGDETQKLGFEPIIINDHFLAEEQVAKI